MFEVTVMHGQIGWLEDCDRGVLHCVPIRRLRGESIPYRITFGRVDNAPIRTQFCCV